MTAFGGLLALLAGLALLTAFVRHCARVEHPFVDVRLFRERSERVFRWQPSARLRVRGQECPRPH